MRYIPNNEPVRREMLKEIGQKDMAALFRGIPEEARLKRPLAVPPAMPEEDQLAYFQAFSDKNETHTSFLGGGSYPHYAPLVSDSLLQRAEFLTSYTPYQPEISQGTLQAIFEFQTFMTQLTGMEVANASMYDGASATAEAVLMSERLQRGRNRILLPDSLHPHYRQVVATHVRYQGTRLEAIPMVDASGRLDLKALEKALGDDVAAVVLQQPNFFGVVEDVAAVAEIAHRAKALLVVVVTEALSLALLETPGAQGADIVVGEAQSFGVGLSYGGPYLGFMATKDSFKRQLPGRIAGETVDLEGRRGYVLTLATREQHIRREKATSNICTNQNLVMLSALMYLTLMGGAGLNEVARHNVSLMAYFRGRLKELKGYAPAHTGPVFNEITLTCPRPAAQVAAACQAKGILPGLDLGRWNPAHANRLLVAVTETKRKADIDALIAALKEVAA